MQVGDLVIEKFATQRRKKRIGVIVGVNPTYDDGSINEHGGWVLWNGNFDWEFVYEWDIEIHNGQKLSVP